MWRLVVRVVAATLVGSPLVGCSASRPIHPFTVNEVRAAFAKQRLRPSIDFDASTATDHDIARLARLAASGPETQQLVAHEAATYKQMRGQRVSLLVFPSGSPVGAIGVVVALDPSHAARTAATVRHRVLREHATCASRLHQPQTTGYCIQLVTTRRANVVVFYPTAVKPSIRLRVQRAIRAI